jgi:hypothetical protein
MNPKRVGRNVGVGARVAARILRDRTNQASDKAVAHVQKNAPVYADRGRRLGDGSRRLGVSLWRPFAHASSVLWLEVTGLFFGIFTLFFIVNAIRFRTDWQAGPAHQRFLLYFICSMVFLYFTLSSFARARRKRHPRG